ncbi:MAG TPA: hypothetical protein VFT42_02210 [Solirubrobacteraceae bacterium]|nr:hypothetical protein [Solirubrobacteraceae bacterium]
MAWVLAAFALLPATAQAHARAGSHPRPLLGIGDQKPDMFSDPRFAWLGVRHVRLVVSWDVMSVPWERAWTDQWLADAHADGTQPLVAFGHSWYGLNRRELPSVADYRRAFLAFRARYPWVRDYTPWNEANHCSQPTCHHPARAAAYFEVVHRACPACLVTAADVLDQPNMDGWLRQFLRALPHGSKPRLWGLHNYLDANRLRSTGTRRMLRTVRGTVWFTETGGVVHRHHYSNRIGFEESPQHAALATSWILRLADSLPRVRRVYLYQWDVTNADTAWDSGLIGPFGIRPAFDVLARARGRDPKKAPSGQKPAPPPQQQSPPPQQQSAPPPQQQSSPPPQQQSSPPPSSSPPPPSCFLNLLCT